MFLTHPVKPLTPRESAVVADHLRHLGPILRYDCYATYVDRLGFPEAYSVGCLALCLAARTWKPDAAPFRVWSRFYIRGALIEAVQRIPKERGAGPELAAFSAEPTPDRVAEARDAADRVLAVLPERQRQALCLRARGFTFEEAGRQLGISRSNAGRLHTRSLERVHRLLPNLRGDLCYCR